jgi:hypothetical protein
MPFVVGQIVRPKREYADHTGELRDVNGLQPAQGRVAVVIGAGVWSTIATIWNPKTGLYEDHPGAAEDLYTVKIWDQKMEDWVLTSYGESQLLAGTVGGSTVAALFLDPELDVNSSNLVRTRS